jgi:hypothetical protein
LTMGLPITRFSLHNPIGIFPQVYPQIQIRSPKSATHFACSLSPHYPIHLLSHSPTKTIHFIFFLNSCSKLPKFLPLCAQSNVQKSAFIFYSIRIFMRILHIICTFTTE